jgi:hypothetical protein
MISKVAGNRPGGFTVDFQWNFRAAIDARHGEAPAAHRLYLLHGEVLSGVDAVNFCQHFQPPQVADRDQVEVAVVEERLGANFHAAAEKAAIAHGCEQHGHASGLAVVDGDGDFGVVVGQKRAHYRGKERHLAAQPLRALVGPACNHAGESHRRYVDEVARRFRAVMRDERHASHVDAPGLALAQMLGSLGDFVVNREAAAKIAARPARDDAELGRASGRHEAIGYFRDGPVAAEGNHQAAAALRLFLRQRARVPRRFGESGVERAKAVRKRANQPGPALFAVPATRTGIDDDDRLVHGGGK